MTRRAVPILAAVVAALLAGGVVGVVAVDAGDRDDGAGPAAAPGRGAGPSSTATSTTGGGSTAPTVSAVQIRSVVPSLQAFVEQHRGLRFKKPVEVTLLADDAFEARLLETDEEELEEVEDAEAVLKAMGLLDADVDLVATVRRFAAEAVLGFYDTETKELVVRGGAPTPFVRATLVHELTHALEDQHFGLDREELGDEAFLGFEALVEGSAIRLEDRYRRALSRQERDQLARDEAARGSDVPTDVPEVVQIAFGFPYAYGPGVVEALLRAGGQPRLDAAFARPPASSEHVLHPDRYLGGDVPREVARPRADRRPFDDGQIGELFLLLMLRAELGDDAAARAAEGWGGDAYVAWREGRRTCVRMKFAMDTPGDEAELRSALAGWAARRSGSPTASGLSLTTCG